MWLMTTLLETASLAASLGSGRCKEVCSRSLSFARTETLLVEVLKKDGDFQALLNAVVQISKPATSN